MQGRLSPPAQRLQSFPWASWELEFDAAKQLGFGGIEWLFEHGRWQANPIFSPLGRDGIRSRISATGVVVTSVCATYFMDRPFFRTDEAKRRQSVDVLCELVNCAADVGAKGILLPVLEIAEIRTDAEKELLLRSLQEPLEIAAQHGLWIGLETNLPEGSYLDLVSKAAHSHLGVYYDVGNATAAGYDAAADLYALRQYIIGVHAKDRLKGGSSVRLGEGDVDFAAVVSALRRIDYSGAIVLETPSGNDYLAAANYNHRYIRRLLDTA